MGRPFAVDVQRRGNATRRKGRELMRAFIENARLAGVAPVIRAKGRFGEISDKGAPLILETQDEEKFRGIERDFSKTQTMGRGGRHQLFGNTPRHRTIPWLNSYPHYEPSRHVSGALRRLPRRLLRRHHASQATAPATPPPEPSPRPHWPPINLPRHNWATVATDPSLNPIPARSGTNATVERDSRFEFQKDEIGIGIRTLAPDMENRGDDKVATTVHR